MPEYNECAQPPCYHEATREPVPDAPDPTNPNTWGARTLTYDGKAMTAEQIRDLGIAELGKSACHRCISNGRTAARKAGAK